MRKLYLFLFIIISLFLCSCSKKNTVINNVINQEIDIEDVITIETLEDVICATIENVESSVVGIKCVNSNALLKSESFGSGVVVKQDKNKYY